MTRKPLILALICSVFSTPSALEAKSRSPLFWIEGPVKAQVLRVLDGDTVEVLAFPWPQQSVTVKVRLRGVDAPEIHSQCKPEKSRGYAARAHLQKLLNAEFSVQLTDISGGKYFGRVLANLKLQSGEDASREMLRAGLVHPYHGGKRTKSECR